MIRTLIRVCETMETSADEQRAIGIKLYYNDSAPADYQPAFFHDSSGEKVPFFARAPCKVRAG